MQRGQTTQSRPFFESNARRRPTGNDSTESFAPSGPLQKMQVANTLLVGYQDESSVAIREIGTKRLVDSPVMSRTLGDRAQGVCASFSTLIGARSLQFTEP